MEIKTPHLLPFEAALDRAARRDRLLNGSEEEFLDAAGFSGLHNPYRLYSLPVLSVDKTFGWNDQGEINGSAAVSGRNDLLGFSADYNFNFNYTEDSFNSPRNVRFRLSRQDFDGRAMPLGVRRITLGDVGTVSNRLISTSVSGRGVRLSSTPTERDVQFDQVTIDGVSNPGWEIELYHNNQLIDFSTVPANGEYKFEDVDMFAGSNQFRTVLYGPQGEVEERLETYRIAGALQKPGHTNYDLSIVDADESTLPFSDSNKVNKRDGIAYSGSVTHGINRWLTVFGTTTRVITTEHNDEYLSVGANFGVKDGTGRAELFKQVGGGEALDMRYSSRLLNWGYNLQGTVFNDFGSQKNLYGDRSQTFEFRGLTNRTFRMPFGSLGLRFKLDHSRHKDGYSQTVFDTKQSLFMSGFRFDNSIRRSVQSSSAGSTSVVSGNTNVSARLARNWNLRSRLNYLLQPESELSSFNASLRYNSHDEFTAALNLDHNFITKNNSVGLQLGKDFDTFYGSVNTDWDSDGGLSFLLRGRASIAPYGVDDAYIARSSDLKSQNALRTHIFLDNDADGVFSEGDENLEEARVNVDGRVSKGTDENGRELILDADKNGLTYLAFDEYEYNPFYVSTVDGYAALLRPATVLDVNIPIVESGAIDGTAYFSDGQPAIGLQVELVDKGGEVVNKVFTAFDGFYNFEYVKPGDYIVRANSSQKVFVPPRSVSVNSDELFVYGVDLEILEQIEETQSVAETERDGGEVAHTDHALSAADRTEKSALNTTDGRSRFKSLAIGEGELALRQAEQVQNSSETEREDSEVAHTTRPRSATARTDQTASEAVSEPMDDRPVPTPLTAGEGNLPKERDEDARTSSKMERKDGEVAHTTRPPSAAVKANRPVSGEKGGQPATVNQVWIGEQSGEVRISLGLSDSADYKISREADGRVIMIFLPGISWYEAQDNWEFGDNSVLLSMRGKSLEDGGSRLMITGRDKLKVNDVFVIRPDRAGDYILTLDMAKD